MISLKALFYARPKDDSVDDKSQRFLEHVKQEIGEIERCIKLQHGETPDRLLTEHAMQATRGAFAQVANYLSETQAVPEASGPTAANG